MTVRRGSGWELGRRQTQVQTGGYGTVGAEWTLGRRPGRGDEPWGRSPESVLLEVTIKLVNWWDEGLKEAED